MARRAADRRLGRLLAYGACGVGLTLLSLALVQGLLGRRIARAQMAQLGQEVAFSLRLGELALERYPLETVAELSGLQLAPLAPPNASATAAQAQELRAELCRELQHCREVRQQGSRLWVEVASPLDPVWLVVGAPRPRRWPPDPLSLGLALVASGLGLSTLALSLEVNRPLRLLARSLQQLGAGADPQPLAERGARPVRQLTRRFNDLLRQLAQTRRDQATMLAGIGHDLNSPLTRLRLRLHLAEEHPLSAADAGKALGDLDALERITGQFMAYARGEQQEAPVPLDLAALLAELAGQSGLEPLTLELQPLQATVQPTALARALGNLLDNARSHGAPPYRLSLRPWGRDGFEIAVSDGGAGLPEELWPQALQAFRRLDTARGGSGGHCGLGLAIVERVARAHGGALSCRRSGSGTGFTVLLRGRKDLVTSAPDSVSPWSDPGSTMESTGPDGPLTPLAP